MTSWVTGMDTATEHGVLDLGYDGSGEAEDVLRWALDRYHPKVALACSFQHTVLIHMMVNIRRDIRVFAIDTGRLPEETYQCAADVEKFFGIKIEWYLPRHDRVETLMREQGPLSFKKSLAARRECCAIRKVEPLNRALSDLDAWITGIRRDQSETRKKIEKVSIDDAHGGIVKICPLADWTHDRLRDYVKKHKIPYNILMQQGYSSVGCACCTRPMDPDGDPRSGRWWWEAPEHKECGIHVRNWQI